MKAAPMQSEMKNPINVPAQICILIRLIKVFSTSIVLSSCDVEWSLDEGVSSRLRESVAVEVIRPLVMSCSTNESRTETMIAASIVSPGNSAR
jgi:hypothetical protein